MNITVTTDTGEARTVLTDVGGRASNLMPAWPGIIQHLEDVHRKAFDTAGANLPQPWKPLMASTRQAKRKRGFDPRTLVRDGALRDSVVSRGAGHVERKTPGELVWGTRRPTARLHRATGRIPVQAPRDLAPIERVIARWIVEGRT